jgi:hypothetical protein
MKSSAYWKHSKLVLGVFVVFLKALQGCTSTMPSASTPTEPPAEFEVVSVRGAMVETDGAAVGRLDDLAWPLAEGARAELYVAAFPTEEFDAEITSVTRHDGRYAATVQLLDADARLVPSTQFEGRVVSRPALPIARGEEATP